ncbi:MAG: RES family NAD+ phosphorylase [Deltaproteobacteria bacterium]|nr:RES family NAD+ phosphorylase [Deltaproteobacteria bacterium]
MNPENSYACHRCFKDKVLFEFIRQKGQRGWCNWCGARNVYVVPLYELGDIFRDVIPIYSPGDINGDRLSYLLQEDWNVFSERIEQSPDNLMQELTVSILKAGLDPKDYHSGDYPDYNDFFYRKEEWLVGHWQDKAEAYFLNGQKRLKESFPSIHREPIDDLPDQLEAAFEDLSRTYEPDHILYRARIHDERLRNERFSLSEMGMPPPEKSTAGRANRKSESVLYLANNARTALAEVRAWKGMAVAIARFQIKKPLSVVSLLNCDMPESPFFQEYLEWKIQLGALFDRLAEELSQPALPNEDENIYFSTQYLCDWINKSGYDGIEYPSAMGAGYNVALFRSDHVEPLDVRYFRVKDIIHKYDELVRDELPYEEGPFDYLFMK